MIKRLILAIAVCLLLFWGVCAAVHAAVYEMQSGGIKPVAWSPSTPASEGYEYYFLQIESGGIFGRGTSLSNGITVRFRTPGTYALWVRGYRVVNGIKEFGPWSQSTDPAFGTVSGMPAPWLIRVKN